jgi:putative MATE family efflux protein
VSAPESRSAIEVDGGEGSIPSVALVQGAALPALAPRARADRDIWSLSWPVILSGIVASIVSLADVAMLGQLGTAELVAVGWVNQVFMLAQSVLMAGGVACVALMARAIGAGAPARARQSMAASLVLALAVAVSLLVITTLGADPLLRALGVTPAVIAEAVPYCALTMASAVVFAVAYTYESAFRSVRDTRMPLAISGAVAAAKVGLNVLLIFGAGPIPRLALIGAGLASLLAQLLGAWLFIAASGRHARAAILSLTLHDLRASRPLLAETVRVALPAAGERVLMTLGLMSYFVILSRYDEVVIAAYTIGVRLLSFSWIPGTAFSAASATLVGQALGASDPDHASRVNWRATRLCVLVSTVIGIAYAWPRKWLAGLFTQDPAVIAALEPLILMLAIAQPFLAMHFTLGGSLRGAGDTMSPLWAATVGTWVFRVGLALLLGPVLGLELTWVWSALIFDHLVRAAWMAWSFERGAWRRNLGVGMQAAEG